MRLTLFKILGLGLMLVGLLGCASVAEKTPAADDLARPDYALVIHGGAGTILKANLTAEKEAAYTAALSEALLAGQAVLAEGGSALDAVETTIRIMEDSPLFNAGKGAVFTHDGRNEMDASIMDGRDQNAGAIAGVTQVKNPISLARSVMENSRHVMLAGEGAEVFARARMSEANEQIDFVDPAYFKTGRRLEQLQRALEKEKAQSQITQSQAALFTDEKFGTVGAVALDTDGNIAAGTSTGGMTNKRWNRIGDSPVIGAGTYADNKSCGVSATGHGEYFIRATIARDVCAMMEYAGVSLKTAADTIIHERLDDLGGTGGIVALDKDGHIAMPFNTEGMYRGYIKGASDPVTLIYK